MKLSKIYGSGIVVLAALLSVPAWASNNASAAVPGTVNYVEGQAYAADQPLDKDSIGKVTLEPGQTLNTDTGKTELLLTPGVFLRVGDNSSVKMISAGLENTEVRLEKGHAMIEVDQIYPQNNLRVDEGDASARILKPGLYDFDLRQGEMRVFDGEAMVNVGDRQVRVKGDHELAVTAGALYKTAKFDKKSVDDNDLYRWSSLRSDYEAEANVDAAHIVYANGWGPYWNAGFWGPGWGWGGWYWDPWFSAYTFMPVGGIFYSPFGWGFYSPGLVYRAPFYAGHFDHTFNAANVRAWGPGEHYAASSHYAHGAYTGAGADRGAFHSGAMMASRGGFGGGGFRGGEGGGFHGGGGFGGGHAGGR
jgi:hypothetical protein